jgi:hypothetical protein
MFIVTPDGVIATDPIGYARPEGDAGLRCNEIKKVHQPADPLPVYSHHQLATTYSWRQAPSRDAGARCGRATRRAKERLDQRAETRW